MNSRIRQTTINGKSVQIYMLRAGVGIAMAQKLGTLAASFFSTEGDSVDIDFGKIADGLSKKLSYEELKIMIDALLKDIAIDNKEVNFDEYFSGNYGLLIKILAFALKENFGSFFEELDILGG